MESENQHTEFGGYEREQVRDSRVPSANEILEKMNFRSREVDGANFRELQIDKLRDKIISLNAERKSIEAVMAAVE